MPRPHSLRSRRRIPAALVTVFAVVAAVTGCGSTPEHRDAAEDAASLPPLSSLTATPNPAAVEGLTTVVVPDSTEQPSVRGVKQKLPVTVTSHGLQGDTSVTVPRAKRVLALSLSGNVAEYVYALGLGKHLVGRDVSTKLPGLEKLPVVTREGHSLDAEAVLALNPDVVITDGTIGPTDVVEQLADAGVAVVFVDQAATYDESFAQAQQIADALGVSEAAPPLVEKLRERIRAKEAEIAKLVPRDPAKRPRVAFLYMRGKGVFYLFGEGSGVDSLFASLKVHDVAKEIGWKGQRPMNDEALVKANPDTILVMVGGLKSVGGVDGMLDAHPAVRLTKAGEKRRVIEVPDTSLFTGGTRIPDILDGLARGLYAPETLPAAHTKP